MNPYISAPKNLLYFSLLPPIVVDSSDNLNCGKCKSDYANQ